jgi:hypothetical protein
MILFCAFLVFLASCGIVVNGTGNRSVVPLVTTEWCEVDL